MKTRITALLIAIVMVITLIPSSLADETVVVTSPFTAAVAEVRNSVVGVYNYKTVSYGNGYGNSYGFGFGYGYGYGFGNYGRQNQQEEKQEVLYSSGSAVVVAENYLLTNYHVVDGASRLSIYIYNEETGKTDEYDASLAGYDENLDLAVLYVKDLGLKPVKLGDSDTLQIGDWAICIGTPLSDTFYGTVTAGIISALNRAISESSYDKYGRKETNTVSLIQTDAAINSGNSGGGMFSVTGELMGIPERKYTSSSSSSADVDGIGMCIPINSAKELINKVVNSGITAVNGSDTGSTGSSSSNQTLVGKPRLGITVTSNPYTSAIMSGVFVSAVDDKAPAAIAGMQAGDIIVDIDGTVISSVTQLQSIIAEHKEGDSLKVKVYRIPGILELTTADSIPDGEYVDLQVSLAIVDQVAQ